MKRLTRIVSGGQTGVDRAALDFAVANAIPYGGWCPKGGWAEDFPDPPGLLARYPGLLETPERDPRQRTEWNVRDSDATLNFTRAGIASPGTAFAIASAKKHAKPYLVVDVGATDAANRIGEWLRANDSIRTLNIAGSRESESPGIYAVALSLLRLVAR